MAALIEAIAVKRKMYFELRTLPITAWMWKFQHPRRAAAKRWCA